MRTPLLLSALLSFSVAAACSDGGPAGPYEFVSADGYEGQRAPTPGPTVDAGTGSTDGGGGDERTVEEGDIYRVLGDGLLLNLNSYRGLQVIDIEDVDNPQIIGAKQVTGTPVEMYVRGDTAIVLMNSWRGYYGARDDVWVDSVEGGLVMTIDISDPAAPEVVDSEYVPGHIQKSRVVGNATAAALYVVTGGWAEWREDDGSYVFESRTVVKSFDVSTAMLLPSDELNLGGYVSDIQATPEALIVARSDWERGMGSRVSLLDISDPTGRLVLGDEIAVEGQVETQFNMDLRGGILRVASGSTWSSTRTNHLQTYDASDLGMLVAVDHCTYGEGEELYATLFLEDRAFMVTYERVDPFHAFALDAAGHCEERAEFIVSGWNDYFRAVIDDTRLIGIGVDDASGSRTMAVSLYDITDLDNPTPLVARQSVEADSSWSEASFDHRAFSVLEDAVTAMAPDGTEETGLVLLPFTGWEDGREHYVAAVQIYTFSDSTLTRRGLMEHGSPVRRSFQADEALTANLSEAELSLYDTADPSTPMAHGRLELAPSYRRLLTFGDHRVRLKDDQSYWSWWGPSAERPVDQIEIISAAADPDRAEPVARIEVPAGARLVQAGDSLLVVDSVPLDTAEWPYSYQTTIVVYDLTDPTAPTEAGLLVTDRISPDYGYGYPSPGPTPDCFDCRGSYYGYGYGGEVTVVGDAVVFPRREAQEALAGIEHVCHTWPMVDRPCTFEGDEDCTFYDGGITCRSLDGAPELCDGAIAACTFSEGDVTCEEIDPATIETHTECGDRERFRYWQSMSLDVLDVSDPTAPVMAERLTFAAADEAVSLLGDLGDDDHAYYTYRRPIAIEGDGRPHVAWFFRAIDLREPSAPVADASINVPGELITLEDDILFTRDLRWSESRAETVVHRLEWRGDRAYLLESHRFTDRLVQDVRLDGAGHVLVTDRASWHGGSGTVGVGVGTVGVGGERTDGVVPAEDLTRLNILDAASLAPVGAIDVDSWATLNGAQLGRALFQVPGGLLLVDLRDATAPEAQAHFALRGWPSEILFEGDEILFAAGPYGIYRFDADTRNITVRE